MAIIEPFRLDDAAGGRGLDGAVHLPELAGERPAVVLLHGFKGFADWAFLPPLADLLAARGFVAVRFSFSGAGMRPGEDLVSDLEAFRRNTFSREIEEAETVLAALGSKRIAPGRVDRDHLALFGHSRGGGVALLVAAREPWRDRLRALVTWAAVSTFDRLGEEECADWRASGTHTIVNQRTGQELPLGLELLEDLEAHRAELDLLAAAGRRRAPWLLVHGERDETVPIAEGAALQRAAAPPALLQRVADGDHTLGARHPFQGPTRPLVLAMNATQQWLTRALRDG